jgi:hypothetical protein
MPTNPLEALVKGLIRLPPFSAMRETEQQQL